MTTEFNLSEKIIRINLNERKEAFLDYIRSNDVKEFIKLLKEVIQKEDLARPKSKNIYEFIDALAGEKLK